MIPNCLYCSHPLPRARFIKGYGYDGNGFFCSLRHGYYYGLRIARERSAS
jgi:hypothetical protein